MENQEIDLVSTVCLDQYHRMGRFRLAERRKNEERKRRALRLAAATKARTHVTTFKVSIPLALVWPTSLNISLPIECYSSSSVSSLSHLQFRIKSMQILSQGVHALL